MQSLRCVAIRVFEILGRKYALMAGGSVAWPDIPGVWPRETRLRVFVIVYEHIIEM